MLAVEHDISAGPAIVVFIAGLVLGAVSMVVYRLLAPQRKIDALKVQVATAQKRLRSYDGSDPKQMMRLTAAAITPALKQFAFVAGPTLAAILPVLLIADWLNRKYAGVKMWNLGPRWFGSWEAPFTIGLCIAAIAVKLLWPTKQVVS